MNSNILIVAPHPDDEIIGCFEILEMSNIQNKKVFIIYMEDVEEKRKEAALKLRETYSCVKAQFFQKSIPLTFINPNTTILVPDPFYEINPFHRAIGNEGERLVRAGFDVIFYSTNMTGPYIHEVKEWKTKRDLLNKIYKSEKKLWEYEHKYYLYEGLVQFVMPNKIHVHPVKEEKEEVKEIESE